MRRIGSETAAAVRVGWLAALVLIAGCGPIWLRGRPPTPPPVERVTALRVTVPDRNAVPGLVGQVQSHRVAGGETLLDIARETGQGFAEIRAANSSIDEWVPASGSDVLVPSLWILPRSSYRGLVINIPEMRLYMFPTGAKPGDVVSLLTWPVGIGTEQAPSPVGPFTIRSKDANPTWIVPDSILRTMEKPTRVVPPGPDNPLGAYRIRLSRGLYAIHGTNSPWSIGRLTTHGCIRLYPEDIENLYSLVSPGMPGEMVYQPVKIGVRDDRVFVEVHADVYDRVPDMRALARQEVARAGLGSSVDPVRLEGAIVAATGIPTDVTGRPLVQARRQ